jgi:hypothetical protein
MRLLLMRRAGDGRVTTLAQETGLSIQVIEALLLGTIGEMLALGLSEMMIAEDWKLSVQQIREAARRTGARTATPKRAPVLPKAPEPEPAILDADELEDEPLLAAAALG